VVAISVAMKTSPLPLAWLLLTLTAGLAPGCGGPSGSMSRLMSHAPTALAARPAGMARIVFVGRCGGDVFRIIDDQGTFIGECSGTHWWAIDVAPGAHAYIGWSRGENTTELHATVAADRTYYVYVHYSMGLAAGHAELDAYAPRTPEWSHLAEWTAPAGRVEPDVARGQAGVDDATGSRERRLAAGHEMWAQLEGAERTRRELIESDGQP